MSTTTIRLEEALKARVAAAAERAGKTSHAFILEAIEQTVEHLEAEDAFRQLADERWNDIVASGKSVSWETARTYLTARASGERPRKPAARALKVILGSKPTR